MATEIPGGSPQPASQQIVIQQAPPTALGRYGRFLLIALVIALVTIAGQLARYRSYFSPPGGPEEKFHSLSSTASDKIAIINVEGAILDPQGYVKKQIDRVRDDDSVKAIVLRIDSPGGTVTASDYLYHQLVDLSKKRKLPIVVSMGGLCASGGYYLAMAVGETPDAIFAEPTTWTGSIGVVIPHYDLSGLLDRWDIRDDSIVSDKFKLMGSPTRQLSEEDRLEERKLLQELVDRSFERFKKVVKAGRPQLEANDEAFEKGVNGQIFTSEQALELGLVDQIDFLDGAIRRAAELAKRDLKTLRCIKYEEPPSALNMLLGASAPLPQKQQPDLSLLLDLTAPRAYYLCTWLPAVLSNSR